MEGLEQGVRCDQTDIRERMIQLSLNGVARGRLNILCLGSHSDDIEIGCGGTILRLAEQYPGSTFHWVVFSANGARAAEAQCAALRFTRSANLGDLVLKTFPDGFMPFVGSEVKTVFEELKQEISPERHLYSQSEGCASGPSPYRGVNLEYVSGPFHSGVRDPEV